eukprot:jgi/Orpsp1_1/1182414/evm.model.c7180000081176.2
MFQLLNDETIKSSDFSSTNNNNNNNKYIIKRKKKVKNNENCYPYTKDYESRNTIISKYVLKDLKTKGYSNVKRYPNEEEETIPINDPIHVGIMYNFGFVLDDKYDKHSALILISTVINYNVIHINVVKKLNLKVVNLETPIKVTSSSGSFTSNILTRVVAGVKEDKETNNMFISDYVVSRNDHHKDMIIVNIDTLLNNNMTITFSNETWYRFKDELNIPYVL